MESLADTTEVHRRARTTRSFNLIGTFGSASIALLLAAEVWGDGFKVAIALGQFPLMGLSNVLISTKLLPRVGVSKAEWVRLAQNLAMSFVMAHVLDWPSAVWAFFPFVCVMADGRDHAAARTRIIIVVAAWAGFALFEGRPPLQIAMFAVIGVAAFLAASYRVVIIDEMLVERVAQSKALAEANEKLKAMMVHALAQEKMAGLGLLAAGVAHEINNPMSFVTANLSGLMDDLKASETLTPELIEQRDSILIDTIDGVRRVNAIVSDLRRFASGERESPVPFDVRNEADAAARIVRSQLKGGQSVRVDFPPSLMMFGMPRQIGQVLLNLMVNSAQALKGAGEVVATGREEGGKVEIKVSDDGSGMTPETMAHLFEPFFTTKEVGKGTGLGLSVVHGIIRSHDGTIEVASTPGQGSTFTLTLPARGARPPST